MIELLLRRLSRSRELDQIVVATSIDALNRNMVDHVRSLGFVCEQGSEINVLERFVEAARACRADVVVRITGDCPLIDPELVDLCIREFKATGVDYLSNCDPTSYPDGLDVEVVKLSALEKALQETKEPSDLEHVTPFIRRSRDFKKGNVAHVDDLSALRWTVDEPADFAVVSRVFAHFAPEIHFGWMQVLALQEATPALFLENQNILRNEGAKTGAGEKLWKRAKRVIPGGNMLLSKRAEMFLPDHWPAYYSSAKGCIVRDLDGREFTDMSLMGVGTNTLGYGYPEIDAAVTATVHAGNMSTLNCPEEVFLAEKLIQLHPWAEMARFARSGGEANAICVRIARAASGREKVVVCGYHGWHDWYLAANLADCGKLDGHLLPGLDPRGVPRNLEGTILTFAYNDYAQLEALTCDHEVGVIIMEVSRNSGPEGDFLKKVRTLATEKGIVLVFDECTSGFRQTFGGLHKQFGVEPDMAVFGKALGNGYAITAVIGRRDVMEAAQSTFISSTFWTERIGSVAALKTLEVMERLHSWDTITEIGLNVRHGWQDLADTHGLEMSHWGLPALTGFTFRSENALAYKTFLTQEMLKKGYLAANSVYACIEHTPTVLNAYFDALYPIFAIIKRFEDEQEDVMKLLEGPVCHSGFKRLN